MTIINLAKVGCLNLFSGVFSWSNSSAVVEGINLPRHQILNLCIDFMFTYNIRNKPLGDSRVGS